MVFVITIKCKNTEKKDFMKLIGLIRFIKLIWNNSIGILEPRNLRLLKANEGDELDESPRHGSGFVHRSLAQIWRSAPAGVSQ